MIRKDLGPSTYVSVAILSVIMTFIFNFFTFWLPSFSLCTQYISRVVPTPDIDLLGWPFVVILLVAVLMRIPSMRKYFGTVNIVYLYVITLAVSYMTNFVTWWGFSVIAFSRTVTPDSAMQYVPDFVAFPKDIAVSLLQGNGNMNLPWGTLLPGIIWNFLLIAIFGGMSIGIVSIFRRQWIDVESLPFPITALAYSSIMGIEKVGMREWPGRKPLILGFIVGLLTAIPLSATLLFPWFPDIYLWRSSTCGPGIHQFAPTGFAWNLQFNKHLPVYALMLLVPIHQLFSIVFYSLVLELALQISWQAGYYTGIDTRGGCGRSWCSPNPYDSPPLYMYAVMVGLVLGYFVITIFLQRAYIVHTLRMAFGNAPRQEEGEPMSYRTAWIIFIGGFFAMVLFFIFTGFGSWPSFVLTLAAFISWFTMTRMWGTLGVTLAPGYHFMPGFIKLLVWPTDYALPVTSSNLIVLPIISRAFGGESSLYGWGGPMQAFFGGYKMAQFTGTNTRNTLKVVTVAIFISLFVSLISQLMMLGVYGGKRTGAYWVIDLEAHTTGGFWSKPTATPMSEVGMHVAFGFVFVVILKYLTTRIMWLPDPLGALIGWEWIASLSGVWIVALVDVIIKYSVLKLGGSKLYDEKVIPFIGGIILGTVLDVLGANAMYYVMYRPTI